MYHQVQLPYTDLYVEMSFNYTIEQDRQESVCIVLAGVQDSL